MPHQSPRISARRLGSIVGPLIAGVATSSIGPEGLFLTKRVAHVLMILFTIWRMLVRAPVPEADKTAVQFTVPARVSTPETAALSAGGDEVEPLPPSDPDAPAHEEKAL